MRISELLERKEHFPSVKTLSVAEIAKKHGVSVNDIEQQLKIGIHVEKEHSLDPTVAKEIALDHLLELPDYYTRLKKMENE